MATISAYSTAWTRLTAATMGTVAWPPHETMLTFCAREPTCSCRLTGGTQYGPMAAGVRSIISTPSAASLRAFSWWACAEVASKTMRMPSSATCGTRPSTPEAVVATPSAAARRRPSDAGSTPTTQAGSIHSLRRAL